MFKTIEGAVDCEIWSVISFLNARKALPSEIHHQICQVYGDNAMNDGMVRKWVWMFNEGQQNVHNEVWSGRPSLVNWDLVHKVNERVCDNRRLYETLLKFFLQRNGTYFLNKPRTKGEVCAALKQRNLHPKHKLTLRKYNIWRNSWKMIEKEQKVM